MTAFRWDDARAARAADALTDGGVDPGDLYARVVFSCLLEPGDGVAGALVGRCGAHAALEMIQHDRLRPDVVAECGLNARAAREGLARWRPRLTQEAVDTAVDTAVRRGIHFIVPDTPAWPACLDDLGPHTPVGLWVRGHVAALARRRPAVAVVGARAATGYGEHVAGEISADLAGRGVTVVSGAAYGIDGAAHRAALAADGCTVALLAGGADRAYPAGHTDLLARIAHTGAVVAETPCGSAPTKWRFLQRNRLIAALGAATVVVEAGRRSGSLNTAGHAATLGRPLGAVPGPVTSGSSSGCHRLLREYGAVCITSADDVAELLGMPPIAGAIAAQPRDPISTRILDALSVRAGRTADDVARRAGLTSGEVEAALAMLLLTGLTRVDDGAWRRVVVRRPA